MALSERRLYSNRPKTRSELLVDLLAARETISGYETAARQAMVKLATQADRLAACESLLREMASDANILAYVHKHPNWRKEIIALVGPTPTPRGAVRWNTSIDGESPGRDVLSELVED